MLWRCCIGTRGGMEFLLLPLLLLLRLGVRGQQPRSDSEQQYSIVEELPPGSFVADIFHDSKIQDHYDSSIIELIQFRFLARPEVAFTIEEDTGVIRTGGVIDRDSRCPGALTCYTKLDVVVLATDPMRFFEIIKIRVEIMDVNDNAPIFPEPQIKLQTLESAMPGATYTIPTATDPDSGTNGIQGYDLIPKSDLFSLRVTNKLDGSTDVRLVLTDYLDREKEDLYQVMIISYDGGNPPKSGTVDVIIVVQDANDNDPVFQNSTYSVSIPENMPIQSTIVIVKARDKDSGLYGQVVYMFSDRTKRQYGHLFGVKDTTGEVFVRGVIDYEESPLYHLSVIAKDRGPDSLPADTTVIVHVLDINDHSPAITVNTLTATGADRAEISEDVDTNTFVAHLVVVDRDSGRNGNFSCHLNDIHFRLESLTPGEYKIVTMAALDRETRAQYNLAVTCKDHGMEPQVSIKHIQVTVTDVNDNKPVFSQESYLSNLMENNNVGAFVSRVNATDRDVGPNADIQFELHQDAGDLFMIDPILGTISATVMFDHEQSDYKRFHVLAVDRGTPANTGTTVVMVHINDQNDARPQFSQPSYTFWVWENEEPYGEVGVVSASDADGEPHNMFTFSLLPSVATVNNFNIDSHTGRITTSTSLDREVQEVYYITVVATDTGIPPLSSSVTATVSVKDKNDNDPIFDYPSRNNNTIYISNQAPVGYVITKVTAHDLDIGSNGNLSYHLSRGNEEGMFSIDLRTGVVKVNHGLRNIDYEVYDLVVTVTDHGNPERSAVSNFNVVVNKSIAFAYADSDILNGFNLTIVIAISCGLGLVMVILVIAIAALRCQDRDKDKHKYNCRTEALKMLQAKEAGALTEADENTAVSSPPMASCVDKKVVLCNQEKPKKEVTFNLDVSDVDGHVKPLEVDSPNSQPRHVLSHSPAHQVALTAGQGSPQSMMGHQTGQSNHRAWTLSQKELEVHQLLGMIQQDPDADSAYSGESSNTDSGRGLSEEGDGVHRAHYNTGPGPCPTGDGTYSHREVALCSSQPTHSYSSQPQRMQTFSPKNKSNYYRRHSSEDPYGNPTDSQYGAHGYCGHGNQAGHHGHQPRANRDGYNTIPGGEGHYSCCHGNPGTGTYGRTNYRTPHVPESIPENLDSPSSVHSVPGGHPGGAHMIA